MTGLLPTNHRYPHVVASVFGTPWAILPSKIQAIAEVLQARIEGFRFDSEMIAERLEAAAGGRSKPQRSSGAIGVLPLFGVVNYRVGALEQMSGATGLQEWTANFKALIEDDRVASIVIPVDSPGGNVYGVQEAAQAIYAARGTKPITAAVDPMAASAALWIASAADEVVITPSGTVGSIGVLMVHTDQSGALEKEGYKVTMIESSQSPYKTEGFGHQALSDEAYAHFKAEVDAVAAVFVEDMARNRGVTTAKVLSDFGGGRMLNAKAALAAGLVDRIETFDQVIQRHGGAKNASMIAAFDGPALQASVSPEEQERAARLWEIALSNSPETGANTQGQE